MVYGNQAELRVITSYSIHYTKLYEGPYVDGDPMGIALAGGFIAGSAGITRVEIDKLATSPNVVAEIGTGVV